MYLLKSNICRRKVIVVNCILLEGIHWRVRARPPLIQRLLGHDALASFLLTHLQVLPIIRADLKVWRLILVRSLSAGFVAQRVTLTRKSCCYQARVCFLVEAFPYLSLNFLRN